MLVLPLILALHTRSCHTCILFGTQVAAVVFWVAAAFLELLQYPVVFRVSSCGLLLLLVLLVLTWIEVVVAAGIGWMWRHRNIDVGIFGAQVALLKLLVIWGGGICCVRIFLVLNLTGHHLPALIRRYRPLLLAIIRLLILSIATAMAPLLQFALPIELLSVLLNVTDRLGLGAGARIRRGVLVLASVCFAFAVNLPVLRPLPLSILFFFLECLDFGFVGLDTLEVFGEGGWGRLCEGALVGVARVVVCWSWDTGIVSWLYEASSIVAAVLEELWFIVFVETFLVI